MAALTYFTATGTYLAALKDSLYDVDNDPELTPMSGSVTFTPLIDPGDSLPATTLTPPANLWLVPVKAQIKSGVITTNGATGVKLVANTSVLGLSGTLFYRVDFYDGLLAGGKTYHPETFTFPAPTSATTVDLVNVTPVPGQPATGIVVSDMDDISDATTIGKSVVRAADQAALQAIVGPSSTWSNIPGKPIVVAAGADQASARAAISTMSATEIASAIGTAVTNLIGGAPGALDTLKELADAINDDASFAASVTTALNARAMALTATAVKTAAYTATAGDLVPVDATAGTVPITLPTAPADKTRIAIKKIDTSTNTVTIPTGGSDVFNKSGGSTSLTLSLPNQGVQLQYRATGAIWYVVSTDVPLTGLDVRFQRRVTFHVDSYGADPTGATDSSAAVAAAITALGTSKGVVEFGAGTYRLDTTQTLAYPGQFFRGQGSNATKIDGRANGPQLKCWDSTVPTDGNSAPGMGGGVIGGMWIDGTNNANANAVGLQIGDLIRPRVDDVRIFRFLGTGAIGFLCQNRYSYTEQAHLQVFSSYCTNTIVIENHASHPKAHSSWSYNVFDFGFSVEGNQNGVIVRGNVIAIGVQWTMGFNCNPYDTNTGVAITIGKDNADSCVVDGHISWSGETTNTGAVAHKDINIGLSSRIRGYGQIVFEDFATPFVAGSAYVGATVDQFYGRVNCPSLGHHVDNGVQHVIIGRARLGMVSDGVNYLDVNEAVAGSWPIINAVGADTDVGIDFSTKGAGALRQYLGNGQTTATFAVAGTATNISRNLTTKGTGVVKANGVEVGTKAAAAITSSATPVAAVTAARQQYDVTALAVAATFGAPTGTPVEPCQILYRIKDNGTPQTLAWNTIFRPVGVTLPTTTVANKTMYVGTVYNAADSRWDVIAVGQEA